MEEQPSLSAKNSPYTLQELQDLLVDDDNDDNPFDTSLASQNDDQDSEADRIAKYLSEQTKASSQSDQEKEDTSKKASKLLEECKEKINDMDQGDEFAEEQQPFDTDKIEFLAPGLNIFDPDRFLNSFQFSSLNLENNFSYDKRNFLKDHGLSDTEIDEIFTSPMTFLIYLGADGNSALVKDQKDFSQVCDYLFFACSCALETGSHERYKKALFDLLTRYALKWKLTLSHVISALINLGMKSKIALDESGILELSRARVETTKKFYQKQGKRHWMFMLPKLYSFVNKNSSRRSSESIETVFHTVKKFLFMVTDLTLTFPERSDFQPVTSDWTNQLTLLYLMLYAVSDKHLINDSNVFVKIQQFLHGQMDSFSTKQWCGSSNEKSTRSIQDDNLNNATNNACLDISELISQIGSSKHLNLLKTWSNAALPKTKSFERIDHHHNLVRRLEFFPPTYRGNQVRKNVAFVNFQQILSIENLSLDLESDVTDVNDVLKYNLPALRVMYDKHYVMLNLIRLIDVISGRETTDFTQDVFENQLRPLIDILVECKRHPSTRIDAFKVREAIGIVINRWEMLTQRCKELESTTSIYVKK